MCDKFGLLTNKSSWPDTDYRSYFLYKSLFMLLLLQGKSGTELGGGCCPLQFWQTHASKFDELVKVRRTLTGLRTALFKLVKMRESLRTRAFGQTSIWTTLVLPVCNVGGRGIAVQQSDVCIPQVPHVLDGLCMCVCMYLWHSCCLHVCMCVCVCVSVCVTQMFSAQPRQLATSFHARTHTMRSSLKSSLCPLIFVAR
jgi:hypothetical protein